MNDLPEDYDSEDLFDWRDERGLNDLDPYPGMSEWDNPPPPELPDDYCSVCREPGQLIAVGRVSRLKLLKTYRCEHHGWNWWVRTGLPPIAMKRYLRRDIE